MLVDNLNLKNEVGPGEPKPHHARPLRANPSRSQSHPKFAGLRVLVIAFQGGKQADGGVESLTQLLERYEALRVTVLTQIETAKNGRWQAAGCEVLVWPLGYPPGKTGGWRFTLRRLSQGLWWNLGIAWLAINRGFDLVHINDPHALWHVIFGLKLLGVPTLYNIRDTKPEFSPRDRLKARCAFGLTDLQVVLSREMRAFWKTALTISNQRLAAIYSIVDFRKMVLPSPTVRAELRARLGLPATFVVGYVASFSPKKAQLAFIEQAGPEIQKKIPEMKVYFLGDYRPACDPYAAKCAHAVEALGLGDQFIFKDYTPEVQHWYHALDAVIVATRNEGLARCMIESLACGTPVLSFDVCSAREILEDGPCGAVVAQGDYTRLVEILARWAENKTHRVALGRQGAQIAKTRFGAPLAVRSYTEMYYRLAAKSICL